MCLHVPARLPQPLAACRMSSLLWLVLSWCPRCGAHVLERRLTFCHIPHTAELGPGITRKFRRLRLGVRGSAGCSAGQLGVVRLTRVYRQQRRPAQQLAARRRRRHCRGAVSWPDVCKCVERLHAGLPKPMVQHTFRLPADGCCARVSCCSGADRGTSALMLAMQTALSAATTSAAAAQALWRALPAAQARTFNRPQPLHMRLRTFGA